MSPNLLNPAFLRQVSQRNVRTTDEPEKSSNSTLSVHAMASAIESSISAENTDATLRTRRSSMPEDNAEPVIDLTTASYESSSRAGPISSLISAAADTKIGRAASEKVRESANPTLERASCVVNGADSLLLSVQDMFKTEEGRRLLNACRELVVSIYLFVVMLVRIVLGFVESKLNLEAGDRNLPARFFSVCGTLTKKAKERLENVERRADGTTEAWMYSRIRKGIEVVSSLFKSVLKAGSQFSGPGKQYVVPAVEAVISALPDDLQKSIRESQGPVASLPCGLGREQSASGESTRPDAIGEKTDKIE